MSGDGGGDGGDGGGDGGDGESEKTESVSSWVAPYVCSGCGQPSPGAMPGMGGKVFCAVARGWVEVVHPDSVAAKMARGKLPLSP